VLLSLIGAAFSGMASASAPAPCKTSGLVIWLDTQGSGAAGSVYYRLELTNLSGRTCALRGYPGVSAVGLNGRQIGSASGRDAVAKARTVTLVGGASASAVLQLTDVDNYPAASCHKVTAAGLRVYPPGRKIAKLVPFPFPACSGLSDSFLHVQAVTKATSTGGP
jgi:hypothetical protein